MATVNLLPNGDVSNDWSQFGLGTSAVLMSTDHSGSIATDPLNLHDNTTGEVFELDFQDFSEDFSSIDSVQAVIRAGNNGRGQSFALEMTINNGSSGTFWAAETSGSIGASLNYQTITFTSRTTSDGSSAWTNTDINNLRMKVELTAHSGGTTRATYCYFIVTYTVPSTDNSVFFGTNF